MPEIRYGPVGKCIYCGALPPEVLTDEHIIPLALDGEYLLPKASCKPCEKITGRFEGIVLRGGLRPIKERRGFKSRTKNRPNTLPIFVGEEAGARVELPVEDYPATVILPHIPGPTLAPFPFSATEQGTPWGSVAPTNHDKVVARCGTVFAVPGVNTFAFARMLAKIAHSFAAAMIGIGNFVPFLPPFILNDADCDYRTFMGTMTALPELPADMAKDGVHELLLAQEGIDGQEWITCIIGLFRDHESPYYRVVVGQMNGQFAGVIPECQPASEELKGWRFQRLQFTLSRQ
jgi:hypothetical protein